MSEHQPYSFFQSVERSFDKAAEFTSWDRGILDQIKQCNSVYQMRFPIKREDGNDGSNRSIPCTAFTS